MLFTLLDPTISIQACCTSFIGDQAYNLTLVRDQRAFGDKSEYYVILNGYRIRPPELAQTKEEGRAWYVLLMSLIRDARETDHSALAVHPIPALPQQA